MLNHSTLMVMTVLVIIIDLIQVTIMVTVIILANVDHGQDWFGLHAWYSSWILFVNIKGNIYIYCLAKYFGAIYEVQAEQKAHVGEWIYCELLLTLLQYVNTLYTLYCILYSCPLTAQCTYSISHYYQRSGPTRCRSATTLL